MRSALKEIGNIESLIRRGKLSSKSKIEERVNKVINKYNLSEHAMVHIVDGALEVSVQEGQSAAVAALQSVYKAIEKVRSLVQCGKYGGRDKIGVRVGKVVNKYKMAKHIVLNIRDDGLDFHIDDEKVAVEAALDGVYVVRSSVPTERLSSEDTVRSYKSLSQVERAFR